MIICRKVELSDIKHDIENVDEFSNILEFNEKDNIVYVLENEHDILGISRIVVYDFKWGILDFLAIRHEYQGENLGDGLLRAILNYCFKKGVHTVLYHNANDYLIKMGFDIINKNSLPSEMKRYFTEDKILRCDLDDFFSAKCKSRR